MQKRRLQQKSSKTNGVHTNNSPQSVRNGRYGHFLFCTASPAFLRPSPHPPPLFIAAKAQTHLSIFPPLFLPYTHSLPYLHLYNNKRHNQISKKAHSRVATLIQPSFQKKKKPTHPLLLYPPIPPSSPHRTNSAPDWTYTGRSWTRMATTTLRM